MGYALQLDVQLLMMVPRRIRQVSAQITSLHYPFLYYFLVNRIARALRWDVLCERHNTDKLCFLMYISQLWHRDFWGKGLCVGIACSST